MLPGVVKPLAGDLWELTTSVKALRCEWIRQGSVDAPVNLSGDPVRVGHSEIEKSLVIAVPRISLMGKGICSVRRTLMMPMNLFDQLL